MSDPLADRRRANRVRRGTQAAVEVPVPALRALVAAAPSVVRDEVADALGPRTVTALIDLAPAGLTYRHVM